MSHSKAVHVAVGVIFNAERKVLTALRPAHLHQGGLWEFPGGKVEKGETAEQALRRELAEEVAIDIIQAKPLIELVYDYPDKKVLLDVWEVSAYQGVAYGREGQIIQWTAIADLPKLAIPSANQGIVKTILEIYLHYAPSNTQQAN